MTGTPMPSFADAASDAEMWDLANYVVSLARKPVWSMTAEEVAAFYARQDAEAQGESGEARRAARRHARLRAVPFAGRRRASACSRA